MPYAGGGVAPFRLWHRTLPDDLEVVAVQLPGREARLREVPLLSIAQMIESILPEIISVTDLPYAIFGHSMGALLAYELAGRLERMGPRGPERLFVSGHRSPDELDSRPELHDLPTPAFLVELQARYGAIPAQVLAEQELLDLLVPVVRADIRAVETYRPSADPLRIACPVHVYGGRDDQHPTPAQLAGWSRCATNPVSVRVFPGNHFYLNEQREALTSELAKQWDSTPWEVNGVEAARP
jgi:surfactin synthase thioesterase subunit